MSRGTADGFLALMVSGVPVAIAMAVASLVYVMVSGNIPDFVVIHRMYGGVDSFPLLAVPFFIWAGNLMNSAGITNRIYNFALALVGWMKGGLGHVNVVGSMNNMNEPNMQKKKKKKRKKKIAEMKTPLLFF